jgi:hypothetical protein
MRGASSLRPVLLIVTVKSQQASPGKDGKVGKPGGGLEKLDHVSSLC